MKYLPFLLLFLVGCGTIEQTTTTETMPVNVPGEKQSESKQEPIYMPPSDRFIDSLKQWTLLNLCKGEVDVDKGNIKAKASFKVVKTQPEDPKIEQPQLAIESNIEAESKDHTILGEKKIEESKSTPGQLWILFHSWQFTIPTALMKSNLK